METCCKTAILTENKTILVWLFYCNWCSRVNKLTKKQEGINIYNGCDTTHGLNMHVVFRWNPAARRHLGAEFTWHPGDAASCQLLRLAATVRETNLAYFGCLSCQVGGEAVHAGNEFCWTVCHKQNLSFAANLWHCDDYRWRQMKVQPQLWTPKKTPKWMHVGNQPLSKNMPLLISLNVMKFKSGCSVWPDTGSGFDIF